MNNNLLTENIKKYLISEEAGISNEVLSQVNIIKKKIIELEKVEQVQIHPKKNYSYKLVTFKTNVFGREVNIRVLIRLVVSDYEKDMCLQYGICGGSYNIDNGTMTIRTIKTQDGKIFWERGLSTIQHELEHIFQINKIGKDFNQKPKNESLYNLSRKLSDLNSSEDERLIAYTIYASFKFETNANENGLYSYLIEKGETFSMQELIELIEEHNLYFLVSDLKKLLTILNNNKTKYNTLNSYMIITYNKNLEWFIKLAKSTIKNYTRVFGRVIYKVNKDKGKNVDTNLEYKRDLN
mgnify:CR=1 FL=1